MNLIATKVETSVPPRPRREEGSSEKMIMRGSARPFLSIIVYSTIILMPKCICLRRLLKTVHDLHARSHSNGLRNGEKISSRDVQRGERTHPDKTTHTRKRQSVLPRDIRFKRICINLLPFFFSLLLNVSSEDLIINSRARFIFTSNKTINSVGTARRYTAERRIQTLLT